MGKKMSNTDKFKRRCKKAQTIESDNFEEYFKKIRSKKLKQLLVLSLIELEVAADPEKHNYYGDPFSIETATKVLHCSKRDAYDLLNTKIAISILSDKSTKALTNSLIELKRSNLIAKLDKVKE